MSIVKITAAPLPIEAVESITHDRQLLVENKLLNPLIKDINDQIAHARDHGLTSIVSHVPTFIFGFPLPDVSFLTAALAKRYEKAGYTVTRQKGSGLEVSWKARRPSPTS